MYHEYREPTSKRNWPAMVIILAILGFIVLAVWWMSENFGATFAMAVVGSLVGALIISWGVMLNQKNTETTLDAASQFNRDLALTEKARQGVYREGARLEREAFNARARLQMIDERRLDQLAQQRARLLVDQQRPPQPSQQPQPPAWLLDDEDAADVDARWYE